MPSVLVAGASGYAGALAARLVAAPPALRARARPPPLGRRARARRALPAPPRRRPLEELDLDRHGDVDAAIVAYPHGAAAPTVAALRERGVKVVDLRADFRLRDRATYERVVRPHEAPELIGERGLRPARAATATSSRGADLVAGPGCFPTAALLALAPLARAG